MEHLECILGRDCIDSFKTCLRRYGFFRRSFLARENNGDASVFVHEYSLDPANHPQGSMMQYVCACYSAWRGGIRVRSVPINREKTYSSGFNHILNDVRSVTQMARKKSSVDSSYVITNANNTWPVDAFWSGAQLSTPEMSQVTSCDIPYYNTQRFSFSGDLDERVLTVQHSVTQTHFGVLGFAAVGDLFTTAAADDFGLHFFLGVMPMWRSS